MSKDTKPKREKKITKKQAKAELYKKLSSLLIEYKSENKPKKFERNLKRATKLFVPFLIKKGKLD